MLQPKPTKAPAIKRVSVNNWLKGKTSTEDDGRVDNEGLTASQNVLLEQNGVIRPWPSMVAYGPQPTGTILGELGEFKEIDGATATKYFITVQNVSGTATVWIRKDQDAWIQCTGKTYDLTADCHFSQIDDKVLITNGVDNLSYLDIDPSSVTYHDVVPFTAVNTPSGGGAVQTGMAGTTYTISYKVTASNQGESAGSAAFTVTTLQPRGNWDGSTKYVTITADRETNASYYHVYVNDAYTSTSGQWEYIGSVRDPGSGATWTFVDTGAVSPDYTRTAPIADSSIGPKAKRSAVVNGRVFLIGDPDSPRDIIFGGDTLGNEINFSPYGGGGSTQVGAGGKEVPVKVVSFRTGRGEPAITVLCQSTGGKGKRYILTPQSITIGTTPISYFQVDEDNGEDGTDAPDGVISYQDALWYPSLDGFKSTYTKQQIQNILSTDKVSGKIQPDVDNISLQYLDKCVGVAYKGRLYWTLPVGSTTNNQIWTLDLERGRGWMLPRTANADWLMVYEDNTGATHLCALVNNEIFEFSYSALTSDDGVAFGTYARSGIIKFSEDGMDWASVIDVTFVLLRPRGNINLTVSGLTEDNESSQAIGANAYSAVTDITGWGETGWGVSGWGETVTVPDSTGITRKTTTIEIDEELNWLYWELSTDEAGVDYALSDVIIRYIPIGTKDLTT